MADRILKPDSGNDLVLQNDDASAKIEINEAGTIVITPSIQVDNLKIDGSTISSTDTSGDINLTPNGSGAVNISNLVITASINVSGGTFTTSSAQKQAIVDGATNFDVSGGTFTTSASQRQSIVDNGGTTEARGLLPVGAIITMALTTDSAWRTRNGFLVCDGSTLNSTTDTEYANLYTAIGTTWGGSSASAFNVPDLKGAYLRGIGTSTVFTQDRTITLAQILDDALQAHEHRTRGDNSGSGSGSSYRYGDTDGSAVSPVLQQFQSLPGLQEYNGQGTPRTDNETRPNSIGVQFLIKY